MGAQSRSQLDAADHRVPPCPGFLLAVNAFVRGGEIIFSKNIAHRADVSIAWSCVELARELRHDVAGRPCSSVLRYWPGEMFNQRRQSLKKLICSEKPSR